MATEPLLAACKQFEKTLRSGERFTFEYVMLNGVNDSDQHARQLANLLNRHQLKAKVNLIPTILLIRFRICLHLRKQLNAFDRSSNRRAFTSTFAGLAVEISLPLAGNSQHVKAQLLLVRNLSLSELSKNGEIYAFNTSCLVCSSPQPYSTSLAQSAADINVSGWVKPDKIKRARSTQGNVVMEIPSGLHVQSNKPLDKFLVPTKLEVEAPQGVRIGAVIYPRALLRNLKFSKGKVAVYEGRALIRFNVTVPASTVEIPRR